MKIIYHNDNDGYCSAAIAYKFYSESKIFDKIELIEMDYDKVFPIETITKSETIVIVDFSLSEEMWLKLFEKTDNIIWIDHHKSAIEKYTESIQANGEV